MATTLNTDARFRIGCILLALLPPAITSAIIIGATWILGFALRSDLVFFVIRPALESATSARNADFPDVFLLNFVVEDGPVGNVVVTFVGEDFSNVAEGEVPFNKLVGCEILGVFLEGFNLLLVVVLEEDLAAVVILGFLRAERDGLQV